MNAATGGQICGWIEGQMNGLKDELLSLFMASNLGGSVHLPIHKGVVGLLPSNVQTWLSQISQQVLISLQCVACKWVFF